MPEVKAFGYINLTWIHFAAKSKSKWRLVVYAL